MWCEGKLEKANRVGRRWIADKRVRGQGAALVLAASSVLPHRESSLMVYLCPDKETNL